MPNIKSAKKRVRVTATKSAQNKAAKSEFKTVLKNFRVKLAAEPQNAQAIYNETAKKVDQAAAAGLLHKNNAARKKSAMARAVAAAKAE